MNLGMFMALGCPVHFDGDGVEPGFTIRLTPHGARVEPDVPTLPEAGDSPDEPGSAPAGSGDP